MRLWFQFGSMALFPLGNLFLAAMLVRYRKKRQTSALFPLVVALILNGIWASGLAADFVGREASSTLVFWWRKTAEYALPLASAAIMFATLSFLRHKRPVEKRWLYLTLAGLGGALLLDPDVFPLSLPDTHIVGRIISHEGWWQIAWIILWGAPAVVALWSIGASYPRKASSLHRNRVRYWALAVGINLLGDMLVIYSKEYFQSQQPIVMQGGALVKILGAAVATINALAYRLPDMRIVLRRTIEIVALGAATMGLFILAMMGEQLIQRQLQEPKVIVWATAGLALLLTISYYPVRRLVFKAVEGLVFRDAFDLDAVLRDYGERISQALELDRLAQTVIETVDSALHISHGTLALVKKEASGELTLVPVAPHGRSPLPALTCAHDSPLTRYLTDDAAPLVPGAGDQLGQGLLGGRQAPLSPRGDDCPHDAHPQGPAAGHQAGPCRRANRAGIELRQIHALSGDAVDGGRGNLAAVETHVAIAQIVGDEDQDVGPLGAGDGGRHAPRETNPGGRHAPKRSCAAAHVRTFRHGSGLECFPASPVADAACFITVAILTPERAPSNARRFGATPCEHVVARLSDSSPCRFRSSTRLIERLALAGTMGHREPATSGVAAGQLPLGVASR